MIVLLLSTIAEVFIAVIVGDALLWIFFGHDFTEEFKASSRRMKLKVFLIMYPILFLIPFFWLHKKWVETA